MLRLMTRFVLTPIGSGGDVHPYLGLGRGLKARGHEVVVIVNEAFKSAVEREGLHFIPFGTLDDYLAVTEDPDLWHPQKGLGVVMATITEELQTAWDLIESVWEPEDCVLVGHTLAFATRSFEEKHGASAATIHLAPTVFRSDFSQPAIAPGVSFNSLPRFMKRLMWRAADGIMIDPLITPTLNKWRATHGLPPVSRVFHSWLHSPNRLVALFPEWFAPRQPDWPEQLCMTGFPLFDDPGETNIDPDVERWISDGTPPIVFTPGTANRWAASFFAAGYEAIQATGHRGLFLSNFAEHLPDLDPGIARHVTYVPFSRVLPRCAAIVHHGGIGTCAQGLAAGIPQLVMPMGFDQPDNADRLVRLGVGSWVAPRRFTGKRVANALSRLLGNDRTAAQCRTASERLASEDGVARACDVLEALA